VSLQTAILFLFAFKLSHNTDKANYIQVGLNILALPSSVTITTYSSTDGATTCLA